MPLPWAPRFINSIPWSYSTTLKKTSRTIVCASNNLPLIFYFSLEQQQLAIGSCPPSPQSSFLFTGNTIPLIHTHVHHLQANTTNASNLHQGLLHYCIYYYMYIHCHATCRLHLLWYKIGRMPIQHTYAHTLALCNGLHIYCIYMVRDTVSCKQPPSWDTAFLCVSVHWPQANIGLPVVAKRVKGVRKGWYDCMGCTCSLIGMPKCVSA